jgi:hypothetical protein
MSKDIREQIKGLKIGEITPVFGGDKNSEAFYILKLVDMKSDDTSRLTKMKEEIRGQLYAAEYQRQIQLWIERERQTAFVHKSGQPSFGLASTPPSSSQK